MVAVTKLMEIAWIREWKLGG